MQVSIDGQPQTISQCDCQTLGDVFELAQQIVTDNGRMIVAIECDGQIVAPEKLADAKQDRAEQYSRIDFQTAVPVELAREALEAARGILARIDELTDAVTEHLHGSEVKEAMENMGQLCTCWNDVYSGVFNTLTLAGIDPESVELATGTAADHMSRLEQQLRSVKAALENQDYVQLTDILQYELQPLTEQWVTMVDHLLARIGDDLS